MSPSPAAPSRASVSAWATASASEWPARPCRWGISTPPRIILRPSAKRWESYPMPTRTAQALRIRIASSAAFFALSIPTVATGTPPGTWAVASSASRPFSGPTAKGTPITGRSVSEAAYPGSAAESPAPVITTRKPCARASFTSCAVWSGWRCAEDTWNAYETPALLSTSKAGSIRGLSDSEPTRIRTSGTSGGLLDDRIVLPPCLGGVARVGDEAAHLGEGHPPGRARGRHNVLLHHQGAEVVRAEPQRHLADLRAHRHPGGLDVGDVVEHDPGDRLRAEIRHRVGLRRVRHLGVLGLERPADERGEAARARLHLSHAEQVLDAVGEGLAQAVHHRHGRLQAQPVRRLHHLEPPVGAGFLPGHAVPHLLHQDLASAQGLHLVDLPADLLEREHVPLEVLGPPVERAELAVRDAHVGVVDVPVDDVGDDVFGVEPPPRGVGQPPQLEQGGALVQLEGAAELGGGPVHHRQATCR